MLIVLKGSNKRLASERRSILSRFCLTRSLEDIAESMYSRQLIFIHTVYVMCVVCEVRSYWFLSWACLHQVRYWCSEATKDGVKNHRFYKLFEKFSYLQSLQDKGKISLRFSWLQTSLCVYLYRAQILLTPWCSE